MKTVNLYFQVHQPWRLKVYRFFNIGKDHNYLDDFTNRAIMQKVARQCYLPMNALLLNLIKEHKPYYNILLKDDKTYPFLKITNEDYPQVLVTRKVLKDGARYFGPYPSVNELRNSLEMIRKIFPFRS